MNIDTAQHLQSICIHAIRSVQGKGTLKDTKAYTLYQLVARPAHEGLEVEKDACNDTYYVLEALRTKAAFIQECEIVVDDMNEWIADWRAKKMSKAQGFTTVSTKKVGDEYQVRISHCPSATYFTDDKLDAVLTAQHMADEASRQGWTVKLISHIKPVAKLPSLTVLPNPAVEPVEIKPVTLHIYEESDGYCWRLGGSPTSVVDILKTSYYVERNKVISEISNRKISSFLSLLIGRQLILLEHNSNK